MKKIFYCLIALCITCICNTLYADSKPDIFDLEDVIKKAKLLSLEPYKEQNLDLPSELAEMNYDEFKKLRYTREAGPWYHQNNPFELQFFHLGSIYKNPVKINQIIDNKPYHIPYQSSSFTKDNKPLFFSSSDLDYAGFRLHYPLNTADYYDELISFLGASYFRALGKNQKYGISARGLAIDTGVPTGEEFPVFKEFWIKRPDYRERNMTIYALLDSPRVSAAYEFFIQPGANTKIDVTAVLFPREDITKAGIAPLTSMYLFGENTKNKFFDYRPEVHDSDGLLVLNGNGEWLWRPLDNSKHLRMSSFVDKAPKGFGLMQRDRNPDHYQDLEAYYQERPSVWIEPKEGFTNGNVHLVEIPSDKEIHDNVVAFWWPEEPLKKDKTYTFKYRMNWISTEDESVFPKGKIVATYTGIGGVSGSDKDNSVKFVIDFNGGELNKVKESEIRPNVTTDKGEIKNIVLQKNNFINGFRLFFDYIPSGETAEIRASIKSIQEATRNIDLTEVWMYQYLP